MLPFKRNYVLPAVCREAAVPAAPRVPEPSPEANARYYCVLVAATFLMASGFIAGKILLANVPPLSLVGGRFVVASVVVLPLALVSGWRAFTLRDGASTGGAGRGSWRVLI